MRKERTASFAILLLTISIITARISSNAVADSSTIKGPREGDLGVYYYSDVYSAYRALEAGEIDMLDGALPNSWGPPPPEPVDDVVWVASFGPECIANNALGGRYVGTDDPYNGFGVPNWTGNFTITGISDVDNITAHALPLTSDEYIYTLTVGVDYLVHVDEYKIELLTPLDVQIVNEHWVDGVNNTLNGWPYINYVASGIESVYVKFPNSTERFARNDGYQMPPPSEWWYEPDFPVELEGWWALGYAGLAGPWTWPVGSEWWINYTAASYVTINYEEVVLPPPVNPFLDAINNPSIVTCQVPDSGFCEFDLNNNYTIMDYPDWRSPMSYTEMRQTIAFLSDKDYYVGTLLSGMANRIDQIIAAPYYGWANASMSYPFYPYEYSPAAAKAVLDTTFPPGATANPDHDPLEPLSSPTLRTYPAGHEKAGQDLDPMKFKVRNEYTARRESGHGVVVWMRKLGVPIDEQQAPSSVLYPTVMQDFNYHFYTGGWSVGRSPPMSLYGLYHSINAFPGGSNYVTGGHFPFVGDNATDPRLYRTHPKLDQYLYDCNYATTYSDAITACRLAAGYMTEICVNVPLWSSAGYWGWSKNLLGVVNKQGDDPENDYTFLNAYKPDGSPIRYGIVGAPASVNIVYSQWTSADTCLNRMNLFGGTNTPAYNVAAEQAGFVTDWETTTWDDGGEDKTLVRMTFRDDGYFAKPVSGDQGENVNASHYFWNAWLDYQVGDGRYSSDFADLHHIDITGTYDFEIYFDTLGYWNTYYCQGPLRPMDTWMDQGENFINQTVETFTNPTTPGDMPLTGDPIWIDYVTFNGAPLSMFTDYNIVLGKLHVYSTLGTGTLEVSYHYIATPTALRGYTPGDIAWQTIFEGAGQYYCTSFAPTVGGTFKRNPFYFRDTPPLGEVDFVAKYNGEFAVDIFDLSYMPSVGAQGTGIPSSNWFPGADLFPPGGVIDEFDWAVVINAMSGSDPEHEVALISSIPLQAEVTSGQLLGINVTISNEGSHHETIPIQIHANCTEVVSESLALNGGENATVTVFWDTSGFLGSYLMSTFIGPVIGSTGKYEGNLWNNILLDSSLVVVEPVEHTIVVETAGQKYNLTVESDATLTHIIATKNSLHLDVTGQSGRVAYLNACIPAGLNTTEIKVFVNNVKLTYPPFPVITTNGTHYFVYVEISLSTHSVDIQYATPEVTVTNVSSSKTIVGQGHLTAINATVQNLVEQERNLNLTVYADQDPTLLGDEIIIEMRNVTLTALESRLVSFAWNTTGLDKGTYTITVTADNAMVYGSIFITIPGDNNGDRKVDIFDIVRMAKDYGKPPPVPFDLNCDIDGDGDIDIFDLVIAAGNYGKSW